MSTKECSERLFMNIKIRRKMSVVEIDIHLNVIHVVVSTYCCALNICVQVCVTIQNKEQL